MQDFGTGSMGDLLGLDPLTGIPTGDINAGAASYLGYSAAQYGASGAAAGTGTPDPGTASLLFPTGGATGDLLGVDPLTGIPTGGTTIPSVNINTSPDPGTASLLFPAGGSTGPLLGVDPLTGIPTGTGTGHGTASGTVGPAGAAAANDMGSGAFATNLVNAVGNLIGRTINTALGGLATGTPGVAPAAVPVTPAVTGMSTGAKAALAVGGTVGVGALVVAGAKLAGVF